MPGSIRRGFLLGKFMPPHSGHVGLCRAAMAMCDRLSILVCTRDVEPIPGDLRAHWMRSLLPGARILHMHRDIPQEPADHPDFWSIWRRAVAEHHPEPIDRVFGSEPYVARLAAELDAEPVLVDPDRLAFPVSGTAVRTDPAGNWAHVPGVVRPWYQKRVVTFGPESVGKTTLAGRLAERLGSPYVPEYGRTYDLARGLYRGDAAWGADDFQRIAEGHVALRAAIAPTAGPILAEDTDPLLTAVWAKMLTGSSIPELEDGTELADLYLLLDTDVPWRNDGTRYFGDDRRSQFRTLCREMLDRREARIAVIGGNDWRDREEQAWRAVQAIQGEPFQGRFDRGCVTALTNAACEKWR